MKESKGLILLVAYIYVMIGVSLTFGEKGMFWLPLITLMLIAAYESVKWRNKK
jgi:hypothetical protein